jgi:hypothetical protein
VGEGWGGGTDEKDAQLPGPRAASRDDSSRSAPLVPSARQRFGRGHRSHRPVSACGIPGSMRSSGGAANSRGSR